MASQLPDVATPQFQSPPAQRGCNCVAGLDLGTTNSAITTMAIKGGEVRHEAIMQRVSENQCARRPLLPSFLYLPGSHELPDGATALPWNEQRHYLVGEYARNQGARIPGRVVSSAKSWLAHRRAEPGEAILPWEALKDTVKVSAIEASRRYLTHLREAYDYDHPDFPLALQHLVLTVPASFDEIARDLTLVAAEEAGLGHLTLLEEPQAAFYSWMWQNRQNWRQQLKNISEILVCDIGGGTSDFTVIRVSEQGLERIAVGDHLMLGGDNFDIALAKLIEPRLGGQLDMLQMGVLRQQCRQAKELLLQPNGESRQQIVVPGSGSQLLGGALSCEISRAETAALILDGFFPFCAIDEPLRKQSSGLREWGLPYAEDPAIPRHLAAFLRLHNLHPDAVLFNGGACQAPALKERICTILAQWFAHDITVLDNQATHLAVAEGAAYFGWLKLHGRERIRGGSARSYYLGISESQSLCLIHRSQEEGELQTITEPELKIIVGKPAAFPLYAAADRPQDQAGTIVENSLLKAMGTLETVIPGRKNENSVIPVHLSAQVTEIGSIAIWAASTDNERRWALQLPLRGRMRIQSTPEVPLLKQQEAQQIIASVFASKPRQLDEDNSKIRPRSLLTAIESSLGNRDNWPSALNRNLWESFLNCSDRRRCTPEYEAAWFNAAGFLLRPGIGFPLDKWRVEQMTALLPDWLQFSADERVRKEFWIFWRRLAAGMSSAAQAFLWSQMAPKLLPGRRHIKSRIKNLLPGEKIEFMRLAVSLERVPLEEKSALGQILFKDFKPRPEAAWQLARLGARRLVGGGPQNVLPAELVIPWVESLLAAKWSDPRAMGFALEELCRRTGMRSLDLPETLRKQAAARLEAEELPDKARRVLEIIDGEEHDTAQIFGEALPIGLRL